MTDQGNNEPEVTMSENSGYNPFYPPSREYEYEQVPEAMYQAHVEDEEAEYLDNHQAEAEAEMASWPDGPEGWEASPYYYVAGEDEASI